MKKQYWQDAMPIILLYLASLFLGDLVEPVYGLFDNIPAGAMIHPLDTFALLLYLLTGLLFGYRYGSWYKNLFFTAHAILLAVYALQLLRGPDGYRLLIGTVAGYVIGYAFRRIILVFKDAKNLPTTGS